MSTIDEVTVTFDGTSTTACPENVPHTWTVTFLSEKGDLPLMGVDQGSQLSVGVRIAHCAPSPMLSWSFMLWCVDGYVAGGGSHSCCARCPPLRRG